MTYGTVICSSVRMVASTLSTILRRGLSEGSYLEPMFIGATDIAGTPTQPSSGGRRPF